MSDLVPTVWGMSTSLDVSTVAAKAERFRQLHTERILVLPNAWDVASALIAVQQGAQAVATTSAGVAWSRGSADGNRLSRGQMLDGLISTVAAVDVPVSVDIEAGFGTNDDEVCATVRAVVDAGGVGVNIEDRTGDAFHSIPEQAARIAGIRAVADEAGVPLFINARTDIYLSGSGDFDETVDRARAYVEAGASGVFVPGPVDLDLIGRLVATIPAPLNIMVGPGSPTIGDLADAGVRRASAGSSIAQAVYGHTRRAMAELLTSGTYTELAGQMAYSELNALMD